ncbi:MAG: hypothetical protein R3253_09445, partial [Longimicrobiales bacterium]|nr:hypothetical protein [Longimicrobiales bacterium]
MSISSKDTIGLALAAGTVVLLLVHGGDRHDPATQLPALAGSPADVVAFVDVHLVDGVGDPDPEQVVVVRNGVVTDIGPMGTVELPADALVVDCGGLGYLVAAKESHTFDGSWQPVVRGATYDLVLLSADPQRGFSGPEAVRGRLVDGLWT